MFLDIGVGIMVAIFTSHLFDIDLSFLLVAVSILFALLPDADFLCLYFKKHDTKYDHEHRDVFHYPLLYLSLGTVLIALFFGKIWAIMFFITSLLHFIHDSIAIGWGIKWLFPFSKNNYAFFYLYSKKIKEGMRRLVFVFNECNLPGLVQEHGDQDWVKNIYFKWHIIAKVEFGFFALSVIVLLFWIYG